MGGLGWIVPKLWFFYVFLVFTMCLLVCWFRYQHRNQVVTTHMEPNSDIWFAIPTLIPAQNPGHDYTPGPVFVVSVFLLSFGFATMWTLEITVFYKPRYKLQTKNCSEDLVYCGSPLIRRTLILFYFPNVRYSLATQNVYFRLQMFTINAQWEWQLYVIDQIECITNLQ